MLYGVECTVIADTSLKHAAAITPPARGKNARLSMQALAPVCTSVDPSYAAHVAPIKTWATAYWESWADRRGMCRAYAMAASKLGKAKGAVWRHVYGTAAAALVYHGQIRWQTELVFQILFQLR